MRVLAQFILSAVLLSFNAVQAEEEFDLDLLGLYELATYKDLEKSIANSNLEKFEYLEQAARGKLLPQISFSSQINKTNYTSSDTSYDYSGNKVNLNLQQIIYNPSVWSEISSAEKETKIRKAQIKQVANDRTAELVSRYFEISRKNDALNLAKKELEIAEISLNRIGKLQDKKLASEVDALTIQSRVMQLKAELIKAENELKVATASLYEIVGEDAFHAIKLPTKKIIDASIELDALSKWLKISRGSSPILQVGRAKIELAQANLSRATDAHKPTVSFQLGFQHSNVGSDFSETQRTNSAVASLNLNIPIYSGGSISSRADAQASELMTAKHQRDNSERLLEREIRSAYGLTKSYIEARNAAKEAVSSAQLALEASEKSFRYGINDIIKVSERSRDLFSAEQRLLDVSYAMFSAYVSLLKFSGTLDKDNIEYLQSIIY